MPIGEPPISFEDWKESGQTFAYGDHRVFYRKTGTGPALLLIHGFPTNSWDWCYVESTLKEHFTLYMPDLLDYGLSENKGGKRATIMDQAVMLNAFLVDQGVKDIHILAHDVGDTVAQELMALQVERRLDIHIASTVLLNGGIIPDVHRPRPVQKLLAGPFGWFIAHTMNEDKVLTAFKDVFAEETQPSDEQLAAMWPSILTVNGRGSFARRIKYMHEREEHALRWVGSLKSTTTPILLINGLADPVSGEHVIVPFQTRVPDAHVARLPGIGHYPQIEAPDLVTEHFLEFHKNVVNA